jgi:2-polyprenyl-3-methyl-5-hydroxy-6-metoxy-1,4-benzoquinol methylase
MKANSQTPVLPHRIFDVLQSFQRTEALKAAIELDVFTAIALDGSSADDIAVRCKSSVRGIRVLCDYLCLTGLIRKQSDSYWLTDEAARYLHRKSLHFMADDATQVYGGGVLAQAFRHLTQAVRTGGTALPQGGTLAPRHPYWVQFARALAPVGAAHAELLARTLDYSRSEPIRLLDIACGHGHYGIAIAKQNPRAEVFAQDWPTVLEVAVKTAREAGLSQRYHPIAGDVFNVSLGASYDLVLLTNFLPDFGPVECVRLLKEVRLVLNENGRAIAVQSIPEDDRLTPPNAPSLALSLLAQTPNGDVHTLRELIDIFGLAGFARTEVLELGTTNARLMIGHKSI